MDWTSRVITCLVALSLMTLMMVINTSPLEGQDLMSRRLARRTPIIVMKKFNGLEKDSVFFLDTSDDEYLNDMTLCSIESAARVNPKKTINLIRINGNLHKNQQLRNLLRRQKNIELSRVHLDEIMIKAGFNILREKSFLKSKWPVFHISDVLRVALLKLYGGIYLDSDAVSIQALPDDDNFIVIETSDSIANGLLKFQLNHPVIKEVLQNLDNHYKPEGWAENGPLMFTRAIQKLCEIPKDKRLSSISADQCLNIHGYSSDKFLLIGTKQFWEFVRGSSQEEIKKRDLMNLRPHHCPLTCGVTVTKCTRLSSILATSIPVNSCSTSARNIVPSCSRHPETSNMNPSPHVSYKLYL